MEPDLGTAITYYGRGPHENYLDRKTGAFLGEYHATSQEFYTEYVYPQEHGNRSDVRYLQLKNSKGQGIEIRGDPTFSFSIWQYSMENLENAKHINELTPHSTLTVNIDKKQMGLGGYDTWSTRAHPIEEHRLLPGTYKFKFKIIPFLT